MNEVISVVLEKKWQEYLRKSPMLHKEYHGVMVIFEDGTTFPCAVVLDCKELRLPKEYHGKKVKEIRNVEKMIKNDVAVAQ